MNNSNMKTNVKVPFHQMDDFWLINQGKYLFSSVQTEPRYFVFMLIDTQERITTAVDFVDVHYPDTEKGHDQFAMLVWEFVNDYVPKVKSVTPISKDMFGELYSKVIVSKYSNNKEQ